MQDFMFLLTLAKAGDEDYSKVRPYVIQHLANSYANVGVVSNAKQLRNTHLPKGYIESRALLEEEDITIRVRKLVMSLFRDSAPKPILSSAIIDKLHEKFPEELESDFERYGSKYPIVSESGAYCFSNQGDFVLDVEPIREAFNYYKADIEDQDTFISDLIVSPVLEMVQILPVQYAFIPINLPLVLASWFFVNNEEYVTDNFGISTEIAGLLHTIQSEIDNIVSIANYDASIDFESLFVRDEDGEEVIGEALVDLVLMLRRALVDTYQLQARYAKTLSEVAETAEVSVEDVGMEND